MECKYQRLKEETKSSSNKANAFLGYMDFYHGFKFFQWDEIIKMQHALQIVPSPRSKVGEGLIYIKVIVAKTCLYAFHQKSKMQFVLTVKNRI